MKRVVISDTSCLIVLSKIGYLDVLKALFEEVWITTEIKNEFGEDLPNWITIHNEDNTEIKKILSLGIDSGEASAIALCLKQATDALLIIDERKGRKIAKELGIHIIGTLGLLLKAKERGLIPNIEEVLEKIEITDFRIPTNFKDKFRE